MNDLERFVVLNRKLLDIERKMYSCVNVWMDPFDGSKYPCVKKYMKDKRVIEAELNVLTAKLKLQGYSDDDLLKVIWNVW